MHDSGDGFRVLLFVLLHLLHLHQDHEWPQEELMEEVMEKVELWWCWPQEELKEEVMEKVEL